MKYAAPPKVLYGGQVKLRRLTAVASLFWGFRCRAEPPAPRRVRDKNPESYAVLGRTIPPSYQWRTGARVRYWLIGLSILVFLESNSFAFFSKKPKLETRPISFLEKLIHERVNKERLKYNLPELQWASDVAEVAREHSQDMALGGYFAHENKKGELVSERLEKTGISFTVSAENLFECENYPNIVEESVMGWMQSPGHRENILNDEIEEAGVGIYKLNGKNKYYITQNFIKRALKFIPLPSRLSEEEINKIFDIIKYSVNNSEHLNISLKERIVKGLINANIPVKRDFIVKGFLRRDSPELKIKVDLMVGNGFIVDFTDREFEKGKEEFGKLITSQGYSAVVLIRVAKEKIEYALIKAE